VRSPGLPLLRAAVRRLRVVARHLTGEDRESFQPDLRGSSDLGRAAVIPLAIGAGALVVVAPFAAVATATAGAIGVWMLSLGRGAIKVFFVSLGLLLIGYAFLEKGMAYAGIQPLFVGEAVLFITTLALLVALPQARVSRLHGMLFAFMAWGLIRTVPYIPAYGLDALRDAAQWGYAVFGIALSFTVEARHFDVIVRWYRRLVPFFVAWIPLAAVAVFAFGSMLPRWPGPGGGTTLIFFSDGQFAVHLSAVAAFILVGLYTTGSTGGWLPEPIVWAFWVADVAIISALNRGSMLAMATAGAALVLTRSSRRWVSLAAVALTFLLLLMLIDPVITFGQRRPVSFSQLVSNATSIVTSSDDTQLQGTKDWRLVWWNKIIGYTFEGPYFWTGKGFGRNIAVEDGFSDGVLRAPHNSHLEFLARTGVPGLILWLTLQASFGLALLRSALRARRLAEIGWFQIQIWLFAFWLAAMVNMSFDPYLEGPHGGIWFWSMFGLGLAALRASRNATTPSHDPNAATPRVPVLTAKVGAVLEPAS
jgi:hypothetical protein